MFHCPMQYDRLAISCYFILWYYIMTYYIILYDSIFCHLVLYLFIYFILFVLFNIILFWIFLSNCLWTVPRQLPFLFISISSSSSSSSSLLFSSLFTSSLLFLFSHYWIFLSQVFIIFSSISIKYPITISETRELLNFKKLLATPT